MNAKRRFFSFDEVRENGHPAYFFEYGEALVYHGGEIFDLREWGGCLHAGVQPAPLPSVLLETPVGIEYGWCHAQACRCSCCCEPAVSPDNSRGVGTEPLAPVTLRPRTGVIAAAPEL
jgi:hypothetical protein